MLEGVLGGVRLRLSLLFPASVIVILSLDDSGVAALCLLAAFVVLLLYFGYYMIATPEQCLTPDQWQKIWR